MNSKTKELELKRKDFKRYITTLLIISIYFYLGAVMNTYIHPSGDGEILCELALVMIGAAAWFIRLYRRINLKLQDNERV